MAGHSHWAGIKHKKAAADKKRGKVFSKHAKAIIIAARDGGGDPEMNLNLKYAIDRAKADNMPKDNITRNIKRGTGELGGATYVNLTYEGFAPQKVAVVMDLLTDNRNRVASELRSLFDKKGGTLGNSGSVSWMFETRGVVEVDAAKITEDELMETALEAGAEDVVRVDDVFEIITTPDAFVAVRDAVTASGVEFNRAEIIRHPTTTVELKDAKSARKVLNFLEELEDYEDSERVSANFDVSDEVMKELEAEG